MSSGSESEDTGRPETPAASGAPTPPADPDATAEKEPEPKSLQDAGQVGPAGVQSWIERQIREATDRGEFDNLPGAGKPLPLADSNDPEWWVKAKLKREDLQESDLAPGVIALRREAETYPDALAEFSREDDVRAVLADYNRRVVEDIRRPTFGPSVPVVAPRIDVDAMVERWRELREERGGPTTAQQAPPIADPARRRPFWWPGSRRRRD